jgi:hypothetical protein
MKLNRSIIIIFLLSLIAATFYRLIPNKPEGFAPQMAMALLGGAMIKDKRWAFVLPLLSLFISDFTYQLLYNAGLTSKLGFYDGQWVVYLAFVLITCFGFLMKRVNILNVAVFSIIGSVFFFLITNYITWEVGQGFARPHTFDGLMLCYGDGITFYRQFGLIKGFPANFILGDMIWAFILFGLHSLFTRLLVERKPQLA